MTGFWFICKIFQFRYQNSILINKKNNDEFQENWIIQNKLQIRVKNETIDSKSMAAELQKEFGAFGTLILFKNKRKLLKKNCKICIKC